MEVNDPDFIKAFKFAFEEIYGMLTADLDRIFQIGTRKDKNESKGGLNLSACALVLLGIEALSRFKTSNGNDAAKVECFVDSYFPSNYRGKFRQIFLDFRNGLLHHFYPKSIRGIAKVIFCVDEDGYCLDLGRLQRSAFLRNRQTFEVCDGTLNVIPQILYIDFQEAVQKFKSELLADGGMSERINFYKNFTRFKRTLGHKP